MFNVNIIKCKEFLWVCFMLFVNVILLRFLILVVRFLRILLLNCVSCCVWCCFWWICSFGILWWFLVMLLRFVLVRLLKLVIFIICLRFWMFCMCWCCVFVLVLVNCIWKFCWKRKKLMVVLLMLRWRLVSVVYVCFIVICIVMSWRMFSIGWKSRFIWFLVCCCWVLLNWKWMWC